MSQAPSSQPDLENGNERDGYADQPPSAQNQPSQPSQPSQGGSNISDSSWPVFSMYSKIAEEEDNKMTDRWTKDADGILIFTGLFSASVAALLAVSIQDLIPNSQDTSAFYIEKIFEQLYLNVTPAYIPSNIPRPPPFSPPRYAIWVNSLWFLSLVISLTAALLATSLQQWARRYIRITQPPRCSPEKRARIRAFFAYGVDNLHIPWAVEGLPALLHLSLFLFFLGVLIFLFNINHTVFWWVIWSVGISLTMYGWITLVPIFRHDSPYYAPLSGSAWLLYTGIAYAFFKVLVYITYMDCFSYETWESFRDLREDYYRWFGGGVEKAAEETASKQSTVIDSHILGWTLGTLGNDDLLEKLFDAIPGFINSSLVEGLERNYLFETSFSGALARFLRRTLSSNSILDSVKSRRLIICMDAADAVNVSDAFLCILSVVGITCSSLPQPIETAHALARWCTGKSVSVTGSARPIVSRILMAVSEHDDRWIALAKDQFGVPEHVLRDNIAHGDHSVLLSIVIHLARQAIHPSPGLWTYGVLSTVSRFDVLHTVPGLQHEFCALWNEIVLEARKRGDYSDPVLLLRAIRHAYIALHQGTEAAPTGFSASTGPFDDILLSPSSYPLCTLASHRSDSTLDSPHPSHIETEPLQTITTVADLSIISEAKLAHTTAQQPEGTTISPSPTDLTITRPDNTSPHIQPFPSASSTTKPIHFLPQVTSLTYSSILTQDLNPSVPIEVSQELRQSTLSATETADPTTYIHTTKTSETPRASDTSLTFLHPDPILAKVTPSTVPYAVVSGLADVSNASQRTASAATLSRPQENSKEHDTAMSSATTYISEMSSTAHSIPHSISAGGSTVERDEGATGDLPIVVSHFRSSPMPMPAPRCTVIPEEVSSFMRSPPIQSDSASHALGSPASLATARSQIALQVTSVLDAYVTSGIRAVSGHDGTHAMDTRIPMEELPHPNQSTAPAPSIDPATLPPEDGRNGRD